MKILELTFEEPSDYSGGGIGVKQSIESLMKLGRVDYLGPVLKKDLFESSDNINILFQLEYDNNILKRILNMFHGVLNGYYSSWKNICKSIKWNEYDLVHIEFTKHPFLVKQGKDNNIPVFTRMHNVERDYYLNLFRMKKSLPNLLMYLCYARAEKKCVSLSDRIITLTNEDKERTIELYKCNNKRLSINPVCIDDKFFEKRKNTRTLLMTGSLWYGPNCDGILWFLENIWPNIKQRNKDAKVIVAGGNPQDKLKKICQQDGVELYENPEEIDPFFERASIYLAPIFSGAGMKVKIAEALMHGMPIVATNHALLGYDYRDVESIKECNDSQEFEKQLDIILNMNDSDYLNKCKESRRLFEEKYSIESSSKFYKELYDKYIGNEE